MSQIPFSEPVASLSIIPIALVIAAAVFIGIAMIVGVLIIVIVANRAEPDRTGRRPLAVYFFGMSFIAVYLALFGSVAIVDGLVQLIGSHPSTNTFQSTTVHPIGDAVARVVVLAGLVTLVGVVLLITHLKRGRALPEWVHNEHGPIGRVALSYVAAVCFSSVVLAAGAFVAFGYELCSLIAPGVFQLSGTRVEAGRTLISTVYLLVASILIVAYHSQIPPEHFRGVLRFVKRSPGSAGGHGQVPSAAPHSPPSDWGPRPEHQAHPEPQHHPHPGQPEPTQSASGPPSAPGSQLPPPPPSR